MKKSPQHAAPRKLHFSIKEIKALPIPVGVERYYVYDTQVPGLALRVSKTASKTFVLYRKIQGVPQRITIGRFPQVTLNDARQKAIELNAAIAERESRKGHCIDTPAEVVLQRLFERAKDGHDPTASNQLEPEDDFSLEESCKSSVGSSLEEIADSQFSQICKPSIGSHMEELAQRCNSEEIKAKSDSQPAEAPVDFDDRTLVDIPGAQKRDPVLPVAKFINSLNSKITDSWFEASGQAESQVLADDVGLTQAGGEMTLGQSAQPVSSAAVVNSDLGLMLDSLKDRLPLKNVLKRSALPSEDKTDSEFAQYFARLKKALGQDHPTEEK